ncbi:TPA: CPBP family intramembrane metalloprotease [Clostridioides difficile]|uniref:CPBP family intramembrane glutamic endopeptidase n=1 Tax=Clostridioides difficile TaxID=1496 RepID=UPI00093FEA3A|nr:CPBP family intramembrane glutamic endopeptidase [Clostridioides difficile]MCJ0037097.1 CPBP family intramembrane metalloprotease [Clostridioides difficile]MCJ0179811.1 CPBP family intramembrane metalloprotease [Clostridioides difficile]MCJ0228893.1 CPBP family intramembrane metalloprotease [Clostridioides difficile]MCU6026135.1 CPBP family intramembrane metalloprotease [Clostridioides difficile]MDB3420290.1 CPBP family intramembrane metalloprotease [Clostridioides difficile]
MNKSWSNLIIKNKDKKVRSGWIIIAVMATFYILQYYLSMILVEIIRKILIATGDINLKTNYFSEYANWLNDVGLQVVFQILTESLTIIIPIIVWRFIMKNPIREMGLHSYRIKKKERYVGMLLGIFNCTVIFIITITIGGGHVTSWVPKISPLTVYWILFFALVAFAEEILNRGFFMAVLRRCKNIYFIMIVPSVIFGLVHIWNPDVTLLSVINIITIGILFSYMFIKSSNIWMCIGYHFTWNVFQGIIYGMPISGLQVPRIITTQITHGNLLNGGMFGIEGGILTTFVNLLSFIFVWYYYRDSKYDFVSDKVNVTNIKN